MFLPGPAPLPGEYRFLPLEDLQRSLPDDAADRTLVAVDAANESRLGRGCRGAPLGALHDQRRPPSRQLALRRRQPRRRRGVLDRRGAARTSSRRSASS
jgi:hypothetical protein